jgi:kynurenine formamidase
MTTICRLSSNVKPNHKILNFGASFKAITNSLGMNFRIVDLTHELSNDMPVFPGDTAPVIEPRFTHEKDGFQELELRLTTHTGTHIDCPRHLFNKKSSLSSFDAGAFYGNAITIDSSAVKDEISRDIIQPYHQKLQVTDYVLFYTGHDRW